MKIIPTVGRVVLFTPSVDEGHPGITTTRNPENQQPCAAIVVFVHGAGDVVNLAIFDHNGVAHARTSVPLIQEGEPKRSDGFYCEWMPYQLGQAKRESERDLFTGGVDSPVAR